MKRRRGSHHELAGKPRLLTSVNGAKGWVRVVFIFLGLAVLSIQLGHPALHPLEIIDSHADTQHACPLSHTVGALLSALCYLLYAELYLGRSSEPLPWLGHASFRHCLAPRAPPPSLS